MVFSFSFVAMPEFTAIVGVWKVSVPKLLAVCYGSTVRSGSWGCLRWLGRAHCFVVTWTRSTVDFVPVGAPIHGRVIDPWKSIGKRFTLLVSYCPLDTVVEERACLGIRL